MSSFDRVFGWLPNSRREWIKFIVAVVLLWLLMVDAITELELVAVPDHWRLNLANNALVLMMAAVSDPELVTVG